MPRATPLVAILLFALSSAPARAADIPCGAVDRGVITVDGLLEDWNDVAGIEVGGGDPDFSFTVKCNYDEQSLYLVVDVRDDVLARTGGRAARAKRSMVHRSKKRAATAGAPPEAPEDHVEIAFGDGARVERLVVYPGDAQADIARRAYWSSGRAATGIEIADALQAKGWAIELRLPLASVPGWSPGVPSLRLGVSAWDADEKAHPHVEKALTTAPGGELGTTRFAEANQLLDAFLRDRKLAPKDVTFDRVARVSPSARARIVVAGRTLAILDDEYAYVELPVKSPRDLLEVRLSDLAGDGRDAVLVRYREALPGDAWREVLAAWRAGGEGLRRGFAVEVARGAGAKRLSTKVSFVPRKAATDIVVEPQPAVGWTVFDYREPESDDVVPILKPWGPDKRARFQFTGDEYVRAE